MFGISAIADDLDEGDETYSLSLLPDETYIADPNSTTITTTIEDNMTSPTVSITPEILIATEGETFAWNFSLDQPAPAGGLSLFLPITVNNDPAPGDVEYNIDGSENISDFEFVTNNDLSVGFNLTITEGATEATLVSEAVSDDITETDESFTTVIADGEDYQADSEQDEVTTIITELPVVSLVTEEATAAEGNTFTWDFSLNQPAPEGGLTLFLPVTDNNDPAPGDVEYNIDGSSNISDFEFVVEDDVSIGFNLTIAEGVTEASLVSEVVADDVEEGEEVFTTVIADGENYRANPAQNNVITTLTDADTSTDLPTVSITPENVSVTEGETFSWNISLSQPAPEGGLALSLPITFNNDPAPGDVEYNIDGSSNIADFEFVVEEGVSESFNITIAEGETEAVLVSQAISDDVAEGEEVFTTAIAEGNGYSINPDQNEITTTISDADTSTDLPTISVVAEPTEVEEGSQLLWNFELTEPVGEGGLTVALDLVEDTDPLPGDITYFVDGSENVTDFELIINEESGLIEQALVTLAEGATEATLVNDIIADNTTEGEESVSFALSESDEYGIDSEVNAASFTILDTSTDLNTSTSTSISFELNDLLVPAREAVVDVTFDLNYVSGIEDSEFLSVEEIADSIENYLADNPADGDFLEVITEDLAEFLVTDAGLGIGDVADSITVELDIEPNFDIPLPFSVTSTVEIAEI
ncbi:hypothetical protein [Pleurocapsa sp. PCC 7319]|uniref:hypothetical protein n=1 Tax=Pleurocapsa sp. PCC 7319 TaxID=118161 RepID=UPI00034D6BE7|nr:hypothetical protein [Pleurocapsa sp. PCC 7319]